MSEGSARPGPDPATVLQRAWSELRLPNLQRMVDDTIGLLNRVEPADVLHGHFSTFDPNLEPNPIADALEACRAELKEECGMPDAARERETHGEVVRQHLRGRPEFTLAFREALAKYRELAGIMLEVACRKTH
jgi:hypothetical protein